MASGMRECLLGLLCARAETYPLAGHSRLSPMKELLCLEQLRVRFNPVPSKCHTFIDFSDFLDLPVRYPPFSDRKQWVIDTATGSLGGY